MILHGFRALQGAPSQGPHLLDCHKQTKIRAMQAELCDPRQTCLAHMYKILEAHSMGRTKQAFEEFVLRMTGMLGFPASASGMASSKERPGGREVKH